MEIFCSHTGKSYFLKCDKEIISNMLTENNMKIVVKNRKYTHTRVSMKHKIVLLSAKIQYVLDSI